MIALVAAAWAESVEPASFDGQLYRMPVDAESTLWADESRLAPGPSARLAVGWLKEPVVFVYDDDGERVAMVDDVLGVDAIAAYTLWRVRAAVDVPVYPLATGTVANAGLGDLAVDVKGTISEGPVGLAVDGRLTLPTATARGLTADATAWEATGVVDGLVGPVLLVANVGVRGGKPPVSVGGSPRRTALVYRGAAGLGLGDDAGLSLDVAGRYTFGEGADERPLEVMVGGWGRLSEALTLRGGVGRGILGGIGAPTARAVVAIGWEPPARKAAKAEVSRAEQAPAVAFLQVPGDTTLPPGLVHVKVRDAEGRPIDASWSFNNVATGQIREGRGMAKVPPGPWSILVWAPGLGVKAFAIDVDTGMTTALDAQLYPERVRLVGDRVEIVQEIRWNGAQVAPESVVVLDELVALLRAHPEVTALRVEGHTSGGGIADDELVLSGQRASAVVAHLVAAGLDPARFMAAGYGGTRPLDRSGTPAAREKNERMELVVTGRR